MRNLTFILCVTLAVLLGSAGVSWSADLQKGLDADPANRRPGDGVTTASHAGIAASWKIIIELRISQL